MARGARRRPTARFRGEEYWARPLRGFGDPGARVALVGLAPAAHGANRTGRMFTGDRSGDWLYAALHRAGFANQPTSERRDDGLRAARRLRHRGRPLRPAGQPADAGERDNCLPYLVRELELLERCRTIVALGAFAWDGRCGRSRAWATRRRGRGPASATAPKASVGRWTLLGCYHPSQQNTFTGRLHRADARRRLSRAPAGRRLERRLTRR